MLILPASSPMNEHYQLPRVQALMLSIRSHSPTDGQICFSGQLASVPTARSRWKRRLVIAAVGAILGTGLAAAVASHEPPVYEAEAIMKAPLPPPVTPGSFYCRGYAMTGEEIMRQPLILARTVSDLQLDQLWNVTPSEAMELLKQRLEIGPEADKPPAFIGHCRDWTARAGIPSGNFIHQALDKMESAMCSPAPTSDTVVIRAKADDRLLSADLANGLAEAYRKVATELRERQNQQALGVLDDQLKEQQERLHAAEEKYLQIKSQLLE